MRPFQELLISCQSQQNDLTLFLASPRKHRLTRNGYGIVRNAVRASVRVKADGRFAKTLVRIVVRLRSVKEGIASDRIKRVQTRGRKLKQLEHSCTYAHHLILWLFSSWLLWFSVYSMYVCISLFVRLLICVYSSIFRDDPSSRGGELH